MKDITIQEFENLKKAPQLVVIDFYSTFCSACDKAETFLNILEKAYVDRLTIAKINIDNNLKLVEECSITKLPTLLVYRNSIVLMRWVGFRDGYVFEKELREFLKKG